MAITPRLMLAVLCQDVEFDADGRPYSLIEPLHAVRKPDEEPWPFVPAEIALYVQLEDAVGTFQFSVEVRTEDNIVVGRTQPPATLAFAGHTNRHLPVEHVFQLPNLSFPRPGVYELFVVCNHKPLPLLGAVEAAARLRVF